MTPTLIAVVFLVVPGQLSVSEKSSPASDDRDGQNDQNGQNADEQIESAPRSAEPAPKQPAAEPQAAEPQAAEPQAAEPQAAEPQAAEPQATEQQAAKQQAAKQPNTMQALPPPKNRERVLILELEPIGLEPATVRVINGLISQGLSRSTSLEIITSADLGALVDLEAERAAVGCETTSCLAEIAGAMGARYVIFGTAGKLGDVTIVQLNLFDSEAARPIAREEVKAANESELVDPIPMAARALVRSIVNADDPILAEFDETNSALSKPDKGGIPVDGTGLGILPIALFASGGAIAILSFVVGTLSGGFFLFATSSLTGGSAGAFSAETKNVLFRPWGPPAAAVAGLGMIGVAIGASVATAGFFVE